MSKRLGGLKLSKLNQQVHERDNGNCVCCGRFVDPDCKFHHVKFKSHGGQDRIENAVTICIVCHQEVHGGLNSGGVNNMCRRYVRNLYPEYWEAI
jgi:5-methylcytosine-specific restriction endonuclease McrA